MYISEAGNFFNLSHGLGFASLILGMVLYLVFMPGLSSNYSNSSSDITVRIIAGIPRTTNAEQIEPVIANVRGLGTLEAAEIEAFRYY